MKEWWMGFRTMERELLFKGTNQQLAICRWYRSNWWQLGSVRLLIGYKEITRIWNVLPVEMYCYRRILNVSWMMRITKCGSAKKIECYREHHAVSQSWGGIQLELFRHIVEWTTAGKNVMTEMAGEGRKRRPCREWIEDIEDRVLRRIHGTAVYGQR